MDDDPTPPEPHRDSGTLSREVEALLRGLSGRAPVGPPPEARARLLAAFDGEADGRRGLLRVPPLAWRLKIAAAAAAVAAAAVLAVGLAGHGAVAPAARGDAAALAAIPDRPVRDGPVVDDTRLALMARAEHVENRLGGNGFGVASLLEGP